MKMQNQNTKRSASKAVDTGRTQKTVIPKVRYHPTIQAQTPGDGARAKTRAGPQSGTDRRKVQENQDADNQVPVVRPRPDTRKKQKQGAPKPVQRRATDPDPLQTPGRVRPEQVPLSLGDKFDKRAAEEVEVLTRGQRTNQDWFTWRKNRITASVAHSIAHCRFVNGKSKTPPTSYLAAVTGESRRCQTRAMSWGVEMEAEVVRRYQELKSAALGHPVSVQDCGLFIDASRPWLAASPDGIVTDSSTGQWLLCLEVKCPYKHRQRRVEDACREDRAFCLEIQDKDRSGGSPVYHLKTSHSYFTQIQCQLAVVGLKQADLVVFTLKETAIVPVTFDPVLWEETVSKLEVFYRDAVLPHLRQKTHQDTNAALKPEL